MTDEEKQPLNRDQMAAVLAQHIGSGWIVNLGIGIPTLVSNFLHPDQEITLHSENGVIGYGRGATVEEATPYVVNAGVQPVLMHPYTSIVHHSDAFAIIRKGLIDATVLGAYEAATNGDFANWKMAGRHGGGIGGAMDLAVCARRVFIMMEHTLRDGRPRLLQQCTLALTATGVVKLIMTDLGLFEPTGDAFKLLEIAPDWTVDEIRALTGAPVVVDGTPKVFGLS
jgi:3-oxoacid CoA-transferase B subunit